MNDKTRYIIQMFILFMLLVFCVFILSESVRQSLDISKVYEPDRTFYVPEEDRDLPKRDHIPMLIETYKTYSAKPYSQVNYVGSPLINGYNSCLPPNKKWHDGMVTEI